MNARLEPAPAPRDMQAARLYRAEDQAFEQGEGARLQDLAAAQALADRVTRSALWRRQIVARGIFCLPDRYVIVSAGRSPRDCARARPGHWRTASAERLSRRTGVPWGEVTLPPWALAAHVLLHELAHVLVEVDRESARQPPIAAHGREFAAAYLALVRGFMGASAAARLRAAFVAERVRYRPARVLSPEQLEAARARGRALEARRKAAAAGAGSLR